MDGETHCENPHYEALHREDDLPLGRNSQPSEIERDEEKQHYGRGFDGTVADPDLAVHQPLDGQVSRDDLRWD